MSDADLGSRIDGIRQLGSVVRAMTGIAGARARTARTQIAAVEEYAAMLVEAQALAGVLPDDAKRSARAALVVFCAEQGFVGGFSERVLDDLQSDLNRIDLYLIGSRGAVIATGRGIVPIWSAAMPSRSASLPKFADRLLGAVFARGVPQTVLMVHTNWKRGQPLVEHHPLFPLAPEEDTLETAAPLSNLTPADLAAAIGLDRLHALLTRAALHAFMAENEARMAAMSAASRQIDDELSVLEGLARRIRQEAITSEIIEIAAGATAGR